MKHMPYESDPTTNELNDLIGSQELYMELSAFEELSLPEQALIGTWELANEVYNGGFMQYFHNSSRDRAKPMIAVLREIDAHRAAAILEAAMAIAGPGTRWGDEPIFFVAINSMPVDAKHRVHELEHELYDELDNLHLQVYRYPSKHRDQINAPADFWTEETIQ
jgi:uncharacterized protein DUF4375